MVAYSETADGVLLTLNSPQQEFAVMLTKSRIGIRNFQIV